MGQKIDFIDKVLARIDRLDRKSIQGYVVGLAGEKKEMERVLDQINEAILLIDASGNVRYANRNAFLWLGFQRFLKGRSKIGDLIQEPLVKDFVLSCLKEPDQRLSEDFQLLTPRSMHIRFHWIPLEGVEENITLLRMEDLTRDKSHGEEESRLRRIEGLIRLAAGVAHEIGNPLNSIQIHIELLKRELQELPKPKQKNLLKFIDIMASETKRLDQIVRSFLRATRNPPLRFRPESVNSVIEEAVEFLKFEVKKRKIRLKLDWDKKIPDFLLDRDRLHQAFINLVKNGMEAMPAGGELAITTTLKDRICMIQVRDQGVGVGEKDLPHIFGAYYTTKGEGSGLGLTQVYQSVQEHGGRIDVKSALGKGSVFTIVLPIRREPLSLPGPRPVKEKVRS